MADETTPEIPEVSKKPAARKPAVSGPGAPPKRPAPSIPVAPVVAPVVAAPAGAAEPTTAAVPAMPAGAPAVPATAAPAVPLAPAGVTEWVSPPAGAGASAGAPAKRAVWPFVLGGGILVFILVVVGVVLAVSSALGAFSAEPKTTVTNYDLSFEKADCALFQSTTTEQFQNSFFEEGFDCAAWVDNARALTVDGKYQYEVKIVISKVDTDTAEVVTNETDSSSGDPVDYTLRYLLTKVDGRWLIDGIRNES